MAGVLEKMVAAGVIVMATPVYFYTMCAQMKTLIDRICSRYTEISKQGVLFHPDRRGQQQAGNGKNIGWVQGVHIMPERGKGKGCYLWNWRLACWRHQRQRSDEAGIRNGKGRLRQFAPGNCTVLLMLLMNVSRIIIGRQS